MALPLLAAVSPESGWLPLALWALWVLFGVRHLIGLLLFILLGLAEMGFFGD